MTEPAPPLDFDTTVRNDVSSWGRAVRGLLLITAAGICVLIGLTASTLAGKGGDRLWTGTATLVGCERTPPISWHGFGRYDVCTASVRWDTGRTETRTLPATEMFPSDVGQSVRVLDLDPGRADHQVVREERERFTLWGTVGFLLYGVTALILLYAGTRALRAKVRPNRWRVFLPAWRVPRYVPILAVLPWAALVGTGMFTGLPYGRRAVLLAVSGFFVLVFLYLRSVVKHLVR
jgi:Family of unknown function (DUF6346)